MKKQKSADMKKKRGNYRALARGSVFVPNTHVLEGSKGNDGQDKGVQAARELEKVARLGTIESKWGLGREVLGIGEVSSVNQKENVVGMRRLDKISDESDSSESRSSFSSNKYKVGGWNVMGLECEETEITQ